MLTLTTRSSVYFFFTETSPPELYTLSLHDALPISRGRRAARTQSGQAHDRGEPVPEPLTATETDRKSTRLNSSHRCISYAVFCLKKKKRASGRITTTAYSTCPDRRRSTERTPLDHS